MQNRGLVRITSYRHVLQMSALAALAAFSASGAVARADSWPGATVKEVFSESREWFVRIAPGTSMGDVVGFASSPKVPYAKAEFYRRQADRSYRLTAEKTLVNPIAPVLFFVTDRGYLATLDNWHNMGHGKIAAFYTPQGELIKSFELTDLFSSEESKLFTQSASSIWWRKEQAYIRPGQQSLHVFVDGKGAELIFEIETGAWQYCQPRGKLHLCRTTNADPKWQAFVEPKLRP